ncbi:hypothetical protein LTR17_013108 [Elasticomyces elasticus]|nr:hypothetical protein LTR17_013108 [Elasticomyces elasticus]
MAEVPRQTTDNVTHSGKSRLLQDLPAELVELITLCLPHLDQAALRTTCRELEAKTQRPFALTNFRDKTFLLRDLWSMQTLADISRHKVYGKVMKDITLVPWQLEPRAKSSSNRTDAQEAEYACIRTEQDGQWKRELWKHSLRDALKNFALAGTCISIAFDADGCNHNTTDQAEHACRSRPCGRARLERRVGNDECVLASPSLPRGRHSAQMLWTILDSGCRVQRLDMSQPWTSVPMQHFGTARVRKAITQSQTLATVEKLDLFLDKIVHVEVEVDSDHGAVGFAEFIRHARDLKHLEFGRPICSRGDYYLPVPLIYTLLRTVSLPGLRVLELSHWCVRTKDLLEFLLRHANSMRCVVVGGLLDCQTPHMFRTAAQQLYTDILGAGAQLEQFSVGDGEYVGRTYGMADGRWTTKRAVKVRLQWH